MLINGKEFPIVPYADLRYANLRYADLRYADLPYADLRYADLPYADLPYADLRYANLRYADLHGANLHGANLRYADLHGANLRYADLRYADLRYANLHGANLHGAYNIPELAAAQTFILPETGTLIGWKKCSNGVIVKLIIGETARRSNATGRKCRAESVKVLDVIGADVGISRHDGVTEYRKDVIVTCDVWNEDRWTECGGGIHFYLTRVEAENHD